MGISCSEKSGPQALPHAAAHRAVQATDAIGSARESQGQDRHAEVGVGVAGIDPAQADKFLVRQAEPLAEMAQVRLNQVRGKPVVARRNRGVRGEHIADDAGLAGRGKRIAVLGH